MRAENRWNLGFSLCNGVFKKTVGLRPTATFALISRSGRWQGAPFWRSGPDFLHSHLDVSSSLSGTPFCQSALTFNQNVEDGNPSFFGKLIYLPPNASQLTFRLTCRTSFPSLIALQVKFNTMSFLIFDAPTDEKLPAYVNVKLPLTSGIP